MRAILGLIFIGLVILGGLFAFVINLNRGKDVDLADIPNLLRCRFGKLSRFVKALNSKLDAQEFIKRFAKAEAALTLDPTLYSLISAAGSGSDSRGFYADAEHSIVLDKLGCGYIALIGFDVEDDVIFVKQIQGRQGYKEHLTPLKWERMLLAVVVQAARQSGMKEVRVQPARNNEWQEVRGHASNWRGKMLYDVTARRSGFKFDENEDCFRLVLV